MANTRKKKILIESESHNASKTKDQDAGAEQGTPGNQQGAPFRLPQSGILYYDSYVDGQKYQTGEIDWIVEGNNYRLYVNIPYAFVGPFVFESRGTVDAYGMAPAIYWSQRGTKAPRYSRFDRDGSGAGQMFFSEKPDFTPNIIPGTQDRFSLMFQLASLLNGDSKIDEAGSIRAIPVVDYNTLEMWQFKSYGEALNEDVPSLGVAINRHYALMQRENDPYKRQVDIWLSKDLEWLPGRIRSLESNGRVLELVFKQKNPLPIESKS
ncbi:DUF3108 domain-containing protein [Polynucleobacter sp. TSB-Sco08W16]|uniref:DUF3108 domain-containing protein n=1 Tax=Polynucleobacter sp. TSB-Sco08W16 TaxID=1758374 RepID=UPI00203F3C29|nr:DUF3108 domain-containing protein [Polynucleobacter sp. TSB-Sco08W16]